MFICKCSTEKTFYLFNAFREQETLGWPRNKNKDIPSKSISVEASSHIFPYLVAKIHKLTLKMHLRKSGKHTVRAGMNLRRKLE